MRIATLTRFAMLAVLLAAPLYPASCLPGPPNLVANCSFETGSFSSWTLSGYDSGPGYNGIDYGVDSSDAHSGSFGAYLGGFGGVLNLNQSLATLPGGAYTITFWLAQSPAPSSPYLNSFSAAFGSASLVSLTQVPSMAFTQYSFLGLASSSTTALTFGFRDDLGFFSIDDISVTPVAAPEPAVTWLVFLAAVCYCIRSAFRYSIIEPCEFVSNAENACCDASASPK